MIKVKSSTTITIIGLLILLIYTAASADKIVTLSGAKLLQAIRQKNNQQTKPSYANRHVKQKPAKVEDKTPKPATAKSLPAEIIPTQLVKTSPEKKTVTITPATHEKIAADELLTLIPAKSLFCARINNFDYTLGMVDQFIAGVAPIPMGVSMMVRMQLAGILGDAQLKGLNTGSSFAIFATYTTTDPAEPVSSDKLFIATILPVSDLNQFAKDNPNCGQPDDNGICKITSKGMTSREKTFIISQIGSYCLLTAPNNYNKLAATIKSISSGKNAGIDNTIDSQQIKFAMQEPVWAYGNIELAAKTFGPTISAALEQFKPMMQKGMAATSQSDTVSCAKIMDLYAVIFKALLNQSKSLAITINPKPEVLNITETLSAIPGTAMADILASSSTPTEDNKLLGHLEDGAAVNFAFKSNHPLWKTANTKFYDLITSVFNEDIKASDEVKKLSEDMIDSIGKSAVCAVGITPNNKLPFEIKYIIDLRDKDKFNNVIEKGSDIWKMAGFAQLYKKMGIETDFTLARNIDSYKGISIDSAKFVIKSTDHNTPQGQAIDAIYGSGFDYRWAMVNNLWLCTVGDNAISDLKKLIDTVKASGPKQISPEVKAALELIPNVETADFFGTYNYLRLFKMMSILSKNIATPMPIPQIDILTKSNLAFAGRIGNGSLQVDIALPKQHVMEIMTLVTAMQQQMMQQMQKQQQLNTQKQPQPKMQKMK